MSINGNPILKNLIKDMPCPNFMLKPAATTPALEPMKVTLPPKSAPSARAHHTELN